MAAIRCNTRICWTLAGFCIALLILWGSLIPDSVGIRNLHRGDLLLHFLAYGLLGGWFAMLNLTKKGIFTTLLILTLYAASVEWMQQYFPPRTPTITDFIASTLGIIVGMAGARFVVLPSTLGRLIRL